MSMKPFKDWCSGVPEFNMNNCCKIHDDDYENLGKFTSDWRFVKCGWKKAGSYYTLHERLLTRTVAITYYIGVSLFGWWPYYKAQKKTKN